MWSPRGGHAGPPYIALDRQEESVAIADNTDGVRYNRRESIASSAEGTCHPGS
jgi:hypothetical protein